MPRAFLSGRATSSQRHNMTPPAYNRHLCYKALYLCSSRSMPGSWHALAGRLLPYARQRNDNAFLHFWKAWCWRWSWDAPACRHLSLSALNAALLSHKRLTLQHTLSRALTTAHALPVTRTAPPRALRAAASPPLSRASCILLRASCYTPARTRWPATYISPPALSSIARSPPLSPPPLRQHGGHEARRAGQHDKHE